MRRITYCAEIGSNHKGVKSLAFEYIRQAKVAGADIAKFQLGHDEFAGHRYQWMRYAPMEWAEDLAQWCKDLDIIFMASVFSQEALELAESVGMERYKVAHQIALDPEEGDLLSAVFALNKPTYVSGKLVSSWGRGERDDVYSIYVHNTYPCYEPHMPKDFRSSGWYGYSSHAHGIGDALMAIARGAMFVEKHFTLDKTEESIKDNHFALSFDEFGDMVKYGNEIARALGNRPS